MHGERCEHALAHEHIERLARQHFHQRAEHVSRDAVIPFRAGMIEQGQRRERRHHVEQRFVGHLEIDTVLAIQRVTGVASRKP